MYYLKDVLERCDSKNIRAFVVSFSSDTFDRSIKFDDVDEFFNFVELSNVNHVYVMQLENDIEDYLITDIVIENVLGKYGNDDILDCIGEEIEAYNEKISAINLDYPSMILVGCAYEGHMFFTCFQNQTIVDGEELSEPEDVLYEMVLDNENSIIERKENRYSLIEKQKEELKELVLNDEDFYLATNQRLRSTYAHSLYHNILGEKYPELKEYWSTPFNLPTKGMTDFVEMLWRGYGKTKK